MGTKTETVQPTTPIDVNTEIQTEEVIMSENEDLIDALRDELEEETEKSPTLPKKLRKRTSNSKSKPKSKGSEGETLTTLLTATKVEAVMPEAIDDHDMPSLNDIKGLGKKTADALSEAKILTVPQLMECRLLDLQAVGVSRAIAKKVRQTVKETVPRYARFVEELNLEDIDGIGGGIAASLREKGLSISLLETTPLRELESKHGISPSTAAKYKEQINLLKGGVVFTNAYEVMKKQENTPCFTYGVKAIDDMTTIDALGKSGVALGETVELFGAFRTGKSQVAHQLCVTSQLPPELGGVGKKAIFIDTEGTFSPSRIKAMHQRFVDELGWKKSFEDVMSDVLYARAYNSDHQQLLVEKLLGIVSERPQDYGVLVLDSLLAHFRAEYAGRGTLAERQQTLNRHLSILGRLADTYNLAIVVTNQVQSDPGTFFGDPTKAAGGNIIGHWATTRFYLRKSKGQKRIMRVYDSPTLPEGEAIFEITENGVTDET